MTYTRIQGRDRHQDPELMERENKQVLDNEQSDR